MLLEDDDGSMPSGSGEPVGVAAGVWYEFSAETVAAGPGPGAAMARMEREEGEREPALLGIVQLTKRHTGGKNPRPVREIKAKRRRRSKNTERIEYSGERMAGIVERGRRPLLSV